MRVFIDTEFTSLSDPQLIRIALVAEDGSALYGEANDYDPTRCSEFVREIVLPQLGVPAEREMPSGQLREELLTWLGRIPVRSRPTLCYDNEIDVRLLEYLIGSLAKGWKREYIWTKLSSARLEAFFAEHGHQHHALWDARANLASCTVKR
ncbi:hypothetical protein [Paraburkholderia sp. A1RO-5L]|uniref:hypothetical protein n=1 Tax=Paraburkholderia sp. A1RO-5L TaxID=3028370 RepID=UPI003B822B02